MDVIGFDKLMHSFQYVSVSIVSEVQLYLVHLHIDIAERFIGVYRVPDY